MTWPVLVSIALVLLAVLIEGVFDLPPLIGPNIMRVRRLLAARSLP